MMKNKNIKIFHIFLTLLLIQTSFFCFSQIQIGQNLEGDSSSVVFGISIKLNEDGTKIIVGSPHFYDDSSTFSKVNVFTYNLGTWTQLGQTIYADYINDQFGSKLGIGNNGNIIAVSARLSSKNGKQYAGQVKVFKMNQGLWLQLGNDIFGTNAEDLSGSALSLSADGTIVAIGSPSYSGNGKYCGQVRVFQLLNNKWTQIGTDLNGSRAGLSFGTSVALSSDGSIVAIGTLFDNFWGGQTGSVSVFKNVTGIWKQLGKIINGEQGFENSGAEISLSADGFTLAVGASGNWENGNNSGCARVYKYINNNWDKIADIKGDSINDFVGSSVSLSSDGNLLAIGASSRKNGLYRINAGNLEKIGKSLGDNKYEIATISGNGNYVALGNYKYENFKGQVRVYDFSKVLSSDEIVFFNMSIFPNLSSDIINIRLENNLKLLKVNIYNTLGQFIRTETKSIINIQNISKGSYFFEVFTDKGKATKLIEIK
jgi:hypothetical protein